MITAAALAKRIEALRSVATNHRERQAEKFYDVEAVFAAMGEAAAKGYRAVRIQTALPVELMHTDAAKELTALLTQAGAEVLWTPRSPSDPDAGERFSELIVKW